MAIVSNGEPRALMLEIEGGDVDAAMQLVRRVRAQMALTLPPVLLALDTW